MVDLPGYVWVIVGLGTLGIPAITCVVLYQGAIAVGLGVRVARAVAAVAAVVWCGWIVGSGLLAADGAFRQDPVVFRPWIGVTLIGAAVVVLLATGIPVVARILDDAGTPARLAMPQTLRIVGGVFLVVLALGKLPAVFALPAGLGDLAIGLTATFVARRLRANTQRRGAIWFNILGIVDLIVAVGIGVLAGLGPIRILSVTPSTEAIALLALALIPTTAVPLAFVLHLVSLASLRRATVEDTQTSGGYA